jgi:hypothetical protein
MEQEQTWCYPSTRHVAFRSSSGLLRGKYYSLSIASRSGRLMGATLSCVIHKGHTARSHINVPSKGKKTVS